MQWQYQFSSAAERVLLYAAGCTSSADYAELARPALLLGLLAESECQAALMLAKHGVTEQSVRERWPRLLSPSPSSGIPDRPAENLLPHLGRLLEAVSEMAAEYANPPMLATEHLLLGLLAGNDQISQWLRQEGVAWDEIEADIRLRHGYKSGPLPMEPEPVADIGADLQIEDCKLQIADWGAGQGGAAQGSGFRVQGPESFTAHRPPPTAHCPPSTCSSVNPHPSTLRIIDAAANRAREGLRVAEDYSRFVLDDRHLTGLCKQLRHDLAALLDQLPADQLLAARETQADVGTLLATPGEAHRVDAAGVFAANFARLQESLRSLEEYGKLLEPAWAAQIKQLRYRSYTLHKAMEITRASIERLANARLYVLIDGRATLDDFRQLAQNLVAAGVHVIQLRDKNLDDKDLIERGRLLRELTLGDCPNVPKENGTVPFTRTLFIINDRPDLAALCRADGVHLGQEDLSVKDARSIVGPDALIGVSTHSIEQARQAVLDGANYIGAGPTFPSGTKRFKEFPGLDFLKGVAAEIRLPAFAIGGITPNNLPQVLATGITRVAMSAAIVNSPDPAAAIHEILEIFGKNETH